MTYKAYDTAQGLFAVDWDTFIKIVRSYHRSKLQLRYSKEVRESQSTINPLSWGLPDLVYIEVDWDKVNSELQALVILSANELAFKAVFAKDGIDRLVHELQMMQYDTRKYNERIRESMMFASRISMREIENSVEGYQTAVEIAKVTRDLSGSILMGAATVVTGGGAAIAVGAAGTVIKTTAKYQDTGSVGVAVVEASQQLVCTVIPIARGAKMGTALKVIISTAADTGKALLEGKSIGKAVAVGSVNLITGPAAAVAKEKLVSLLGKVAAPVVVKVVEDITKKFTQNKIKQVGTGSAAPADFAPKHSENEWTELTFEDDLLLKFAFIDMEKGLGRSWW